MADEADEGFLFYEEQTAVLSEVVHGVVPLLENFATTNLAFRNHRVYAAVSLLRLADAFDSGREPDARERAEFGRIVALIPEARLWFPSLFAWCDNITEE